MNRKLVIAVIGTGAETELAVSDARVLGGLIAQNGWGLITGGRNAGVMKAANEGAKKAGGLTVGILPDPKTEISPTVDIAIVTDTGEARNNIIVLSADVVVACGAEDPGTASEVALALKNGKPVVLLAADEAAKLYFAQIGGHLIHYVDSPEAATEKVRELSAKK